MFGSGVIGYIYLAVLIIPLILVPAGIVLLTIFIFSLVIQKFTTKK